MSEEHRGNKASVKTDTKSLLIGILLTVVVFGAIAATQQEQKNCRGRYEIYFPNQPQQNPNAPGVMVLLDTETGIIATKGNTLPGNKAKWEEVVPSPFASQ